MAQYKQLLHCGTGYTVERIVHVKSKELTSVQDLRAESNGECNNLQENVLLIERFCGFIFLKPFWRLYEMEVESKIMLYGKCFRNGESDSIAE